MKRRFESVLVVSKKSAYDLYVRQHKMRRVQELLRKKDPSVERLVRADKHHRETLDEVRAALKELGLKARFRDRAQRGSVDEFDLVLTVGGDGTLLSVSHDLATTPILGINSAPLDSVGFLAGAQKGNVLERLSAILDGSTPLQRLTRMRVSVDGREVHRRVLNEVLFAHKSPAMTSRYFLTVDGVTEEHKSSGFYIGPAVGSTAAIRSAGGRVLPLRSKKLQLIVREPYTPDGSRYQVERALIDPGTKVEALNKMREGYLFLDGPRQSLALEMGQRVSFDVSPEPLCVFGIDRKKLDAT
jgi:NAD+ kinase